MFGRENVLPTLYRFSEVSTQHFLKSRRHTLSQTLNKKNSLSLKPKQKNVLRREHPALSHINPLSQCPCHSKGTTNSTLVGWVGALTRWALDKRWIPKASRLCARRSSGQPAQRQTIDRRNDDSSYIALTRGVAKNRQVVGDRPR